VNDKETQQGAEWGICLVRWGLLLYIILDVLLNPAHYDLLTRLAVFVAAFGIYNLAVTFLLTFRTDFAFLPTLTFIVDVVALLALIFLSGGLDSPFYFFPVLVILVGTHRFGSRLGLAAALAFVLSSGFYALQGWAGAVRAELLFRMIMQMGLYLLTAAAGVVLGPSWPASSTAARAPRDRGFPTISG